MIDNGKEDEEDTEDNEENDKIALVLSIRCGEIAFQSEGGTGTDRITNQKTFHALHPTVVFTVCQSHYSTD